MPAAVCVGGVSYGGKHIVIKAASTGKKLPGVTAASRRGPRRTKGKAYSS